MNRKNKKQHLFLQAFGVLVIVLALIRCAWLDGNDTVPARPNTASTENAADSVAAEPKENTPTAGTPPATTPPHPIKGVASFAEAFPDSNHVQLEAAQQWGVPPVKDRQDAEKRKNEVVYMGSSPFYTVAHLDASVPYLVPRASILLHDISRNFIDSLQAKGLPLHLLTVSSVLRTEADVTRLRHVNRNATEQSCHLFGTTFDINYNQYKAVAGQKASEVKLKQVLSEVLRDLRLQGRCYVKYEVLQPCFHITVR